MYENEGSLTVAVGVPIGTVKAVPGIVAGSRQPLAVPFRTKTELGRTKTVYDKTKTASCKNGTTR